MRVVLELRRAAIASNFDAHAAGEAVDKLCSPGEVVLRAEYGDGLFRDTKMARVSRTHYPHVNIAPPSATMPHI